MCFCVLLIFAFTRYCIYIGKWHLKGERCALAKLRVDFHVTTHTVGHSATSGEAQASSWDELIDLEEAFEDTLVILRRYALASIAHP